MLWDKNNLNPTSRYETHQQDHLTIGRKIPQGKGAKKEITATIQLSFVFQLDMVTVSTNGRRKLLHYNSPQNESGG